MKNNSSTGPRRILIAGAGFGGVRAALDLWKKRLPNTRIVLVSEKHHFEYTPALYKLATGASPLETCIPLYEIFQYTDVEVVIDTITGGDTAQKILFGASGARYRYDALVLGLGSEPSYFNIPGIKEHSFSFKTVTEALRLKRHLHSLFDMHEGMTKGSLMSQFQFVIVGGGPAGVELASVIRTYVRTLAENHGVALPLVTVDILQGAPRLLPMMPEEVSRRVMRKLDALGINIILGHAVTSEDEKGVYLKDIELNARTIIWTAGVRPSSIYKKIAGLTTDEKSGRIIVDEHLQALNTQDVYVLGDSAQTQYSGTAQTAIYDGSFVARAVAKSMRGKSLPVYRPRRTPYVVPVGPDWAVFTYKNITLSGKLIWLLREFIDLRYFLSILSPRKAYIVWSEGGILCESCPTCAEAEKALI